MSGFRRQPRSETERDLLRRAGHILSSAPRGPSPSPDYAMIVREARGARIVDASGNEYIDYLLGSGPMLLGHAHPSVVAAVADALGRGGSYLLLCEAAVALAEEIARATPCADKVSLHCSGSEAVFFALRLARAHRGRDRILKFEGAYHGQADAVMMSNQWARKLPDYPEAVPTSAGIPASVRADVLVAPFNDLDTTAGIIEAHRDELAAVIVEPMQRTFPPLPGFLEGLRELTARREIPLVFDEVVTGFRLGYGSAQAYYGVTPDLCVLGKSISGGFPIGVVAGRDAIMAHGEAARYATGDWASLSGTFAGHPAVSAAALAVLGELRRPGCYDALFSRGRRLMEGLQQLCDDAGVPGQVLGEPPAFQLWFAEEPIRDHRSSLRADLGRQVRFTEALVDRGVLKAHEKFFVSTAHDDADVDTTLAACAEALARVAAG
jgi:glutamate-1-semialdehyde 2,1-aminomutase